jgi:Ca-activated chloride channel family protein
VSEFRFASPGYLILLLIPIAALTVPAFRRRWFNRAPTLIYSDTRLTSRLPVSRRVRLRWLPDVLRGLAWMLLVIALARPQSGNAQEVFRGQGIDVVLALDISNSMGALDFAPQNRLQAAKSVIAEFVSGREFDRIGLVVFARDAYHQSPLTLDYPILLELLDDVRLVNEIVDAQGNARLLDGTAIGLGIVSAANMLREGQTASRVIILLTDGDNNAGLNPIDAAAAAAAFGIRLYIIGVGSDGEVPIPDGAGGMVTFESDLDDVALASIAQTANGRYFRAVDLVDLQAVYDEIDQLERTPLERMITVGWQDRAPIPICAALFVLMAERLLRRTIFQAVP